MWTSFKKKGRWIEGRLHQGIMVDAYVFDKVMIDRWGGKISGAYPFQEVAFKLSTGKQSVWLSKKQSDAFAEAVQELKEVIDMRQATLGEVEVAIKKAQR